MPRENLVQKFINDAKSGLIICHSWEACYVDKKKETRKPKVSFSLYQNKVFKFFLVRTLKMRNLFLYNLFQGNKWPVVISQLSTLCIIFSLEFCSSLAIAVFAKRRV